MVFSTIHQVICTSPLQESTLFPRFTDTVFHTARPQDRLSNEYLSSGLDNENEKGLDYARADSVRFDGWLQRYGDNSNGHPRYCPQCERVIYARISRRACHCNGPYSECGHRSDVTRRW